MKIQLGKCASVVVMLLPFTSSSAACAALIAHYEMAEGEETVLYDSSGYDNHGSMGGAAWSTSPYGSALTFDGVDDFVTVPSSSSLNPTSAITVMAWVKWDIDPKDGAPWASIINKNADNQYRLHHDRLNSAFEFAIRTTGGNKWVVGVTIPEKDRWYHVAGTYDGDYVRLYVDGLLEGSLAHFGWLSGSNNPLDIGRRATMNDRYFSGNIGGVRIYDHALTGEEIARVHYIPEPASLSILLWLLAGFGALAHARRPRRSRG